MTQKDLKKIIKSLVKESLQEILMENYIDLMVKKSINENLSTKTSISAPQKSFSATIKENVEHFQSNKDAELQEMQSKEQKRREILNRVIKPTESNNIMKEMFEDTLKNRPELVKNAGSGASIAKNRDSDAIYDEDAGLPENVLEAAGVYSRDWSKYIK